MGCDITILIEQREDADSPWHALGDWEPLGEERSRQRLIPVDLQNTEQAHQEGSSPDPDSVLAAYRPTAPECVGQPATYDEQNDRLFAALANVRNSDDLVCIAEPRGLPTDVTNEVKTEWARSDGHAFAATHLTLAELSLWPGWAQTLEVTYWVSEGRQRRPLSDEKYERLVDAVNSLGSLPHLAPHAWNLSVSFNPDDLGNWRQLDFTEQLDMTLGVEWWRYVSELHRLAPPVGANNTRIIFWFES